MASGAERDSQALLPKRKMSAMGAVLLAGSWPKEMNMIDPIINVAVYYDTAPALSALVAACEKQLWPCERFNSCMEEGGYWVARQQQMDTAYHFYELEVPDEAAIDAFVQQEMFKPLERDHPPWRIIILRAPPKCRSVMFVRIHHTVGDGLGLLFALSPIMGCEGDNPLAKIPLPNALLPASARKPPSGQADAKGKQGSCSGGCGICSFVRGAAVSLLAKADAELSINAKLKDRTPFLPFNGQRVFSRFPSVPMSTVTAAKNKWECSVNDVLLAALTGALRRFGAEICNDPKLQGQDKDLEFKSMMMIGLPRKIDDKNIISALCNNMLFASCPLPIGEPTMAERVRRTVESCNNLKSKAYMTGLIGFTNFAKKIAPNWVLQKAVSETFSKHTLLVTQVPATTVPMTFPKEQGEVVREIQMVFPNVITQVSIISYNGNINGNIVADPNLFPDIHKVGEFWAAEMAALAGGSEA